MTRYLAIALLALAAGCASTARYDAEYETAPDPIRVDWEFTKQSCMRCHSLHKAFNGLVKLSSREDVELLVEDMAERPRSRIQADDIPRIVTVLDWYRTGRSEVTSKP